MSPQAAAAASDAIEAAAFVDIFAAAPPALAAELGLRTARIGGATVILAPKLPATIFNRAIGLGMERPATESDLDAIIAFCLEAGEGTLGYWVHANPLASPAAIPRWLEARGFSLPERRTWAKMLRGTAPPPEIPTPLEVRALRRGEENAVAGTIAAAFGMPPALVPWIEAIFGRPKWRSYAVLADGATAGGGALFIDGADAWLGLGAVAPAFRNRGGQGALMALRIAEAIAAGCTRIATETGEPLAGEPNPSLANMYRCGFERVASRVNYAAPKG
ncbi:MAG: hypothetical protein N2544_07965 [Burkholderiales bacterium]|nr:hypothetical protein [Burkholderiales bacterium]